MNVGESQSFAYTGGIQEYIIPVTGIYKLEAYGAQGGLSGGKGGYSEGYKYLKEGTILYIACGGRSSTFNGGSNGYTASDTGVQYGGGGGATHIALVNGELKSIGKTQFDLNGLIVAGGGGGGRTENRYGGDGGGLEGQKGQYISTWAGGGGTQTAGGSCYGGINQSNGGRYPGFGLGGVFATRTSDGEGAEGGSGYYGGGCGWNGATGGGGSSWLGGVPQFTRGGKTYAPSTTSGSNSGNGKVVVSLIAKGFPTIHAFGKDIVGGYAYGNEISDIKAFGKDLA